MSSIELAQLTPLQRDELAAWTLQHADSLPEAVRIALQQHSALCDGLLGSRRKLSQVLLQLRRALGIRPSSERRNSGDPLGPITQGERAQRPKGKRQRLELNIEHHERLMSWHKQLRNKHSRKLKATRSKLMQMPPDTEQDEDERSEADEAADQAQVREHMARLRSGGEPQPALQSPSEAFMTGAQVATVDETVPWPAPAVAEHEGKVIDTIVEERERFDFTFTVRRLTLEVEKKVIETRDGERHVVSQSTAALGPPRYAVTWDLLAHMSILVVQYAMPMNRLAMMLSTDTKRFSAGTLARLLRYVSQRFAPIYMTVFDSLADAPILSGDDTSCRVLEVTRYFDSRANSTEAKTSPWHGYRNTEAAHALLAQGDNSLAAAVASELGFEHARRNGDGNKKALHTTTISGRSDADDPHSLVVFYRSHLGGFGDLLQMLLRKRKPKHSAVIVQSDLSTVNLVADERLLRLFTLRYTGCSSHARRPFALYEHEDPDYCEAILHLFKGLFIHERGLDLVGRNTDNVRAVRDVDSRQLWEQILEYAHDMTERWSRETKLGEGARYIIRNYDKLTAYLDDPRLSPTNNFSERMLRMEKLIENSSLFRTTLEGALRARHHAHRATDSGRCTGSAAVVCARRLTRHRPRRSLQIPSASHREPGWPPTAASTAKSSDRPTLRLRPFATPLGSLGPGGALGRQLAWHGSGARRRPAPGRPPSMNWLPGSTGFSKMTALVGASAARTRLTSACSPAVANRSVYSTGTAKRWSAMRATSSPMVLA